MQGFCKETTQRGQRDFCHYAEVEQHWEEATVTRVASESEVPPEILERTRANEELDIMCELEIRLENA